MSPEGHSWRSARVLRKVRLYSRPMCFARSGDVAIAHQILGAGPSDIVFVRGMTGDILSTWDQPLLPAAPN
jgi:hypothetical protein